MANVHVRRLVNNFLQNRFFNALPSSKLPQKPPLLPSKTPKTTRKSTPKIQSFNPISPQSFATQYLTKSWGLSLDSAISISKKVNLEEKNKQQFDSVLSLLKSRGFSDEQVIKLIEKTPAILHCRLSTNLVPKFEYLAENGIKGSNLPKLVLLSPTMMFRSLEGQLKPALTWLKRFVTSMERIMVMIQRGGWILTADFNDIKYNVAYLIEQGVEKDRVEELMVLQPRCLHQHADRIKYGVEMIRKMGIKPDDLKFIHALRVVLSLSEVSWKRKVKVFESLGWSEDEVMSTFISYPHCLSCSEEKLRYAMDYYVNTVKIDREAIISYPKVLMYSIQKRVIPRYTVWKILEENKLNRGKQFIWVLNLSEEIFVERFVTRNSVKIPSLWMAYNKSKEGSVGPVTSCAKLLL